MKRIEGLVFQFISLFSHFLILADPSPDWIVGVSGLELCLANCSWVDHVQLNLYPFDAGTDSGMGYIVSSIYPARQRLFMGSRAGYCHHRKTASSQYSVR